MKKIIIAIVGMPGAGKTTAGDFFRKKKITVLRFGDQTDVGVKELGLPLNEKNERFVREKFRKELGMGAYAIKIKPVIDETLKSHNLVVLDGLYSWEEYEYLKRSYKNLFLLCVYAPAALRYSRLKNRRVRSLTGDEVKARDVAELLNLHKGPPIALADFLIKNEGKVKDLYSELEALLKKWQ